MVKYNSKKLDQVFYALSDPTRRAILFRLSQGHSAVSELAEPHHMSLPAVTKHLRVLEGAGLVKSEKKGRIRSCHLQAQPLHEAVDWLSTYRAYWDKQFDALEKFLETHPRKDKGHESK